MPAIRQTHTCALRTDMDRAWNMVTVQVADAIVPDLVHEVSVFLVDYTAWCDGAHVQVAFPYLPAERREILVTGLGPESWRALVGPDGEGQGDGLEDGLPSWRENPGNRDS